MDNAYVHLPDFNQKIIQEILAYTSLYVIITEIKNNYTTNKVGFQGTNRIFQFGGKALTEGVLYLLKKYEECPVNDSNISNIFHTLKTNPDINTLDDNIRRTIKNEIEKRLNGSGYWDYIPLPYNVKTNKLKMKPLFD